jgi:hypothetical protein
MMPYASYQNLMAQLDDMIAAFEQHPDATTREQIVALLGGLDMLHREGLGRLVERIRAAGGGELVDHACADPIVETLLGLYDLAELDLPPDAGESPDGNGVVAFVPRDRLTMKRAPARTAQREHDA